MEKSSITNRKVTVSCRLLPEQKLLIAEKAQQMGMSPAQYMEAKILQENNLKLERTIQTQQREIKRLQSFLNNYDKMKKEEQAKRDAQYRKHLEKALHDVEVELYRQNFMIYFSNPKKKKAFIKKLQKLAQRHNFGDLELVTEMAVDYTFEIDDAQYFMKSVKQFVNENYQD